MYAVDIVGRSLRLETSPGVFSADGPDEGSMLLVETVLPHLRPHQIALDLGCGAGLIGISLATRLARGEVWLVDVDIRATRMAERNLSLNGIGNGRVVLGDGARDLPPKTRFDLVVSNPPTHEGKEVLRNLVEDSHTVLRPGGALWIVVNRLLSIKQLMETTFGNATVEERRGGFIVLRSGKVRGQVMATSGPAVPRRAGRPPRTASQSTRTRRPT